MSSSRPNSGRRESTAERERARDGGRGDSIDRRSSSQQQQPKEDDEDRIGPFAIGDEIGRGSFATVYKGRHASTGKLVAIKAVTRHKLTPKLLDNLDSEIAILRGITHRNIVELKDCLKTESHIYLIMEFCSAGDLSLYIKKKGDLAALSASNQGLLPQQPTSPGKVMYPNPKEGGLNETIVRCFLGQIVDAVRFLRKTNVVHRDIKPQNLLLQPAEAADLEAGHPPGIPVLKVADFGFARWLPEQKMAETLCGSPLYMAPEILRYEKYDAKADLWSVGAVLFEMAVGKPPFRAQNHVDLLRRIEKGEDRIKFPDDKTPLEGAPPPTKVAPDIKALIRRLLKRIPIDRMNFDDFFTEATAVATSGTATGLLAPEQVSARFNARAASPQYEPPSDFIVTAAAAAYAHPPVMQARTPSNPPTPDPNRPAYPDSEPPPFARRQPSTSGASSSSVKKTAPSFAPKYVVAGATPPVASGQEDLKVRDFVAPLVRRVGSTGADTPVSGTGTPPVSAVERFSRNKASDSMTDSNDSILGKDYVVVEKRTVEINALADELASVPKRENAVARRPSRGFLSRPISQIGQATVNTPPSASSPSATAFPPNAYEVATTPPFAIPAAQRAVSNGGHPYSLSSSPRPLSFLSSSPRSVTGLDRFPGSPLALVGSPTAALAKALNMASLKIFGSPTDGILVRKSSARKPLSRSAPAADADEDRLLAELEDLGQKALVLFDFADSKVVQLLPPTPQASGSTSLGTPSYFSHLAAREAAQAAAAAASNPFSAVPSSPSMRRTSSSSSERPVWQNGTASGAVADSLAGESMVLYMRALTFLGRAIDKSRRHWAERSPASPPPSQDFDDSVQWLRGRFNECYDKYDYAKSRAGDEVLSQELVNKLIFDRALEISRAAAVNELRGENPTDCETAYETALWMLQSILDESVGVQGAGGSAEEEEAHREDEREQVRRFVASISTRLTALRRRIG